MDDLIGFVLGNTKREKVMQVLEAKGAISAAKIAKMGHLTPISVERMLKELTEKGLISEAEGDWHLTEGGIEVRKEMKKR